MTKRFLMPSSSGFGFDLDADTDQNLVLPAVGSNPQRRSTSLLKAFTRGCIGLLACLSLAAIKVPAAQAQANISDDEVNRYAKAVLAIEGKRRQIYADAKGLPEWGNISQQAATKGVNVCDLSQTELPGNIYSLCQQLFKASQTEVSRYGFDNTTFNRITQAQKRDRQLQQRIQTQMVQINSNR